MVFLNSPCRETPKNVLKKNAKKKKSRRGGWVGLGFSKSTGGSVDFFLAAPRAPRPLRLEAGASKTRPQNNATWFLLTSFSAVCRTSIAFCCLELESRLWPLVDCVH
jgi:hypothetical protein